MLRTASHSLRAPVRSLRAAPFSSFTQQQRPYHPTTRCLLPYKDDQDRQSLNPRRSEGTKSASDDEVAEKSDAAFNPHKTSPEAEYDSAGKESNGNPLEASGANQDLSKPKPSSQQRSGEEGKKEKSGGSGGKKAGKVAPM